LPLALELAAARLKLLPLEELLERLEHRLTILTSGPRDVPVRQHTLRATLAWSYDLLSEAEQRLFCLLSVFAGGCTLEAVEAVSVALGGQSAAVMDGMASLLDKHLLSRTAQDTSDPRLLMLGTLREYGLEALATRGELEAAREAHAQYYLRLSEEADAFLFREVEQQWFVLLERERDNLRAAQQWSLEQREDGQRRKVAWRLAGALQRFWVVNGHVREGQRFVEQTLGGGEGISASVRANALHAAGWLSLVQGEYERARALCEESLALYRELDDARMMASTLERLGWIASARDDYPAATSLFEESLALSRSIGDNVRLAHSLLSLALTTLQHADYSQYARVRALVEESLALFRQESHQEGIAWALYGLGLLHFQQGDDATARALLEESLALYRALKLRLWATRPLYGLGKVAARQGDLPMAYAYFQESLDLFLELDDQGSVAACLEGWASVVAQQGDATWAVQLWGVAEVLRESGGPSYLFTLLTIPDERPDSERMRAIVRAKFGEQAFTEALAQGRAMTPAQALEARRPPVLASHPPASARVDRQRVPSPSYPNDLTEREMEVLRLVAQGLTDAQIADVLVISPRTVNAHLRSIYSKLGITSRHAATLFALEKQLI
jgi:DNA-binding CsgD family transcriptional regulator/tetratricopeptide (TPR) repeat protein